MSAEKIVGSLGLNAIKDWARGKFMPRSPYVFIRLRFGSEFLGQTWELRNQDNASEVYTGTVDSTLYADVAVLETSATYVLTVQAIATVGGNIVTRYINTDKYFGIYPKTIKYVELVSWANGTPAQIQAMLNAVDAGWLDLQTEAGWQVGDTRTEQLSAMAATEVGESHAAQDVQYVISHFGARNGVERADGGTIHFEVDQKDCLGTGGYMNSAATNAGSWDGCARRTWCNEVYANALDPDFKALFKTMNVTTATEYNVSSIAKSEDLFALRAAMEIFGSASGSNGAEANALDQVDYYKTAANRIKKLGILGSASNWWERSPHSGNSSNFCRVSTGGNATDRLASSTNGLAPFGCI